MDYQNLPDWRIQQPTAPHAETPHVKETTIREILRPIVERKNPKNKRNIYLGGTIILLALFAQEYCHFEWFEIEPFSRLNCFTLLYKKDTKQMQNRPMETTP